MKFRIQRRILTLNEEYRIKYVLIRICIALYLSIFSVTSIINLVDFVKNGDPIGNLLAAFTIVTTANLIIGVVLIVIFSNLPGSNNM